jgi:hypothetical protein
MFFNVLFILGFGCSETGLSSVTQEKEKGWFDEASDLHQDDFDPDMDEQQEETTGDDSPDVDPEDAEFEDEEQEEPYPDDDSTSEDEDVDEAQDEDEESPDDVEPDEEESSDESESSHDEWAEESDDSSDGGVVPRAPFPGEVVITELLINPVATDDAEGEWVELRNVSSSWLNMSDSVLADHGVDAVEIERVEPGSMVVPPGGIFTICAEADYWENGGVECDATFHYRTLGGGFALSNTEDEVRLLSASGDLLDEFVYSEGFAVEGEAMGLRNDRISVSANDVTSNWCQQISFLPFGDGGTPGESNDSCW